MLKKVTTSHDIAQVISRVFKVSQDCYELLQNTNDVKVMTLLEQMKDNLDCTIQMASKELSKVSSNENRNL